MILLDDTEFYSHKQSLTKLLQDIILDYESDPKLRSADNLHTALEKVREEMFEESVGGRKDVPHIGLPHYNMTNFYFRVASS